MFCRQCGTENKDDVKFCKKCGAEFLQDPVSKGGFWEAEGNEDRRNEKAVGKKNKGSWSGRRWVVITAAFLIMGLCAASSFTLMAHKEKRDYKKYIAQAEKYLEDLDYENAEAAYLRAVKVAPKEQEPYEKLAWIYEEQEEYEKAEEILAEGESQKDPSKQSEEVGEESQTADQNSEENDKKPEKDPDKNGQKDPEKQEGEDGKTNSKKAYTWAVEPKIEADDIYYLKDENMKDYSWNALNRQMNTSYAVLKRKDAYGIIGMDGKLAAEVKYQGVGCIWKYYELETKEPVYEPEYDTEMSDYYFVEEDKKVKPAVAVFGDAQLYRGGFYYCDGLHNVAEAAEAISMGMEYQKKPEAVIPVKRSEELYNGDQNDRQWYEELESKYALCDPEGELLTDFIYEECGVSSEGVAAAKKDGKWGYIDEKGKTVIPFEYDASCTYESYVFSYDTVSKPEEEAFCYAASDGYVPLCKKGKWELRDTSGKVVISAGTFEEIRPVHDGKCWVKKDGKWGVIRLKEKEDNERTDSDNHRYKR